MIGIIATLTIVAGGDSITNWPAGSYCTLSAHECAVAAQASTTTAWWQSSQNFNNVMAPVLRSTDEDAVSWYLGTNDSIINIGDTAYKTNMLAIIAQTKALTDKPIVLHVPHHVQNAVLPEINDRIDRYALRIQEIIDSDPQVYFGTDVRTQVPLGRFPGPDWFNDVHPSATGHQKIANVIDTRLSELIPIPQREAGNRRDGTRGPAPNGDEGEVGIERIPDPIYPAHSAFHSRYPARRFLRSQRLRSHQPNSAGWFSSSHVRFRNVFHHLRSGNSPQCSSCKSSIRR